MYQLLKNARHEINNGFKTFLEDTSTNYGVNTDNRKVIIIRINGIITRVFLSCMDYKSL